MIFRFTFKLWIFLLVSIYGYVHLNLSVFRSPKGVLDLLELELVFVRHPMRVLGPEHSFLTTEPFFRLNFCNFLMWNIKYNGSSFTCIKSSRNTLLKNRKIAIKLSEFKNTNCWDLGMYIFCIAMYVYTCTFILLQQM